MDVGRPFEKAMPKIEGLRSENLKGKGLVKEIPGLKKRKLKVKENLTRDPFQRPEILMINKISQLFVVNKTHSKLVITTGIQKRGALVIAR